MRKIAVIVVNVNGVTAYKLNSDGTYGLNLIPFRKVGSVTEAAETLFQEGYGTSFRLDVCIAGTRVGGMIRVGNCHQSYYWQESDFATLHDFPRYPGAEVYHTGIHERYMSYV